MVHCRLARRRLRRSATTILRGTPQVRIPLGEEGDQFLAQVLGIHGLHEVTIHACFPALHTASEVMAWAVMATMGRRANAGSERMMRVASRPSRLGIWMSMSTRENVRTALHQGHGPRPSVPCRDDLGAEFRQEGAGNLGIDCVVLGQEHGEVAEKGPGPGQASVPLRRNLLGRDRGLAPQRHHERVIDGRAIERPGQEAVDPHLLGPQADILLAVPRDNADCRQGPRARVVTQGPHQFKAVLPRERR